MGISIIEGSNDSLFSLIGRSLFSGKLSLPDEIYDITNQYVTGGTCIHYYDDDSVRLDIYKRNNRVNRKLIILLLIHEMVHQYQIVKHGAQDHSARTFWCHSKKIKEKLELPLIRYVDKHLV